MKKTIHIEGMSCQHCVKRVEKALNDITSIQNVKVKLKSNCADIKLNAELNNELIISAIEEVGYKVTKIE